MTDHLRLADGGEPSDDHSTQPRAMYTESNEKSAQHDDQDRLTDGGVEWADLSDADQRRVTSRVEAVIESVEARLADCSEAELRDLAGRQGGAGQ